MDIGIKSYARTRLEDKTGKIQSRLECSMLKEHIIPSCYVGNNPSLNWQVIFNEGPFSLVYNRERKTIHYSNSVEQKTEWDILYLIRQTLDRQLNEQGFITLHASALNDGKKTIVVEGSSGSGKTSLILKGPREGYSFLSNESTVISPNLEVVAGTQIIVYKEAMAKKFFPDLVKAQSPSQGVLVKMPHELYGDVVINSPERISLIVNPKVGSDYASFPSSKKITKHSLFRASSRYISGLFLMDGMTKSCPINLDNSACRENRVNLVNHLVDNVPCQKIEGSPEEILKEIKSFKG
ncbi:MAG: hypothetical protein ACOCUU_01615 [Nanoarchaeota archaeon]